ncbi:hypothetical protein RD110_17060 [Rhodoferax koreense]|uniref:Sel1 repeat family protein n=1 Tax=Rhodoferax koreensis TaxID=1842727 RepID=A0A1P8JY59_9BURK|nr:tetratricopeptide repeat protein [Rhodoferax koreense]APW38700.1 hypothetical protein RD110_17060 [Rhodoferax koreense]
MSLPALPTSTQELAAVSATQWAAVLAGEPADAALWIAAAARLGSLEAQAVWGQWLLDGRGVERNPAEGFKWFLKAAYQGHAMAMNMTGRCLENGWGTEIDGPAAAMWYRKAAQKGLDAGMYNFANQLAEGKSVPKDEAAALAWYRQAADLNHAKSMTKIGRFYENGIVVEKDLDAAFFCFEQGARGGDFRGQFNYAGMLAERGRMEEALQWLRKVPLTATPAYMALVGSRLRASPNAEFRAVGEQMLARAAAT